MMRHRVFRLMVVGGLITFFIITYKLLKYVPDGNTVRNCNSESYSQWHTRSRDLPLIFVGGYPHSGAELIGSILDAHPDIRCCSKTHIIHWVLHMKERFMGSEAMKETDIDAEVLDNAIAAFHVEVMTRLEEPVLRLCYVDSAILMYADYLSKLFPKAQFILVVRDGRAVVHSMITDDGTIEGYDSRSHLQNWNRTVAEMYSQCQQIGSSRCTIVHCEQLVLQPAHLMRMVFSFLHVPRNESFLRQINKSMDEVIGNGDNMAKNYPEILTNWVGQIPPDVIADIADIAPMLDVLGYDPNANPPDYSHITPSSLHSDNT